MNEITIDYDNLETTSQEIIELYNIYKETFEKIKKEIQTFQEEGIWFGDDCNKYIKNSEKYIPYFEQIEKNLNFYGEFLKNTNDIYKTLEQDYLERNINE